MARPRDVRLHLMWGCRRAAAAIVLVLSVVGWGCRAADEPVILATTSSVGNSGLLDAVLDDYTEQTVRAVLVGSGRALEMLSARSADVVISHAPARETAALASHPRWIYRKILYNDFIIVGPANDPASVRAAADAADAMTRIARSTERFLSRGDESGTHEREQELWTAAGVKPDASRLVVAGAGMGQTLRVASSAGAYTLTDRGTYEALQASIELVILHEGDPRLLNTYAVIADPENARGVRFAAWLATGAGRQVIARALREGKATGFTLWPEGVEGLAPDARPH